MPTPIQKLEFLHPVAITGAGGRMNAISVSAPEHEISLEPVEGAATFVILHKASKRLVGVPAEGGNVRCFEPAAKVPVVPVAGAVIGKRP